MDESLYRGFDERAHEFFSLLKSDLDEQSPKRMMLKKRFIEEVRKASHLAANKLSDIRKSFNVAFWAYRKVKRRRGEAYVFHVVRGALVMTWIMRNHNVFDPGIIHGALLHDSYEETDDTWYAQLLVRAVVHLGQGTEVATDVSHLTKNEDESDEAYFFRLYTCKRWRVLMVKFVDRIDNLWTLDTDDAPRRERKIRETEAWFPMLGAELTTLVTEEFKAGRLTQDWLDVVSFLTGYLWYAVREKRREFNMQ